MEISEEAALKKKQREEYNRYMKMRPIITLITIMVVIISFCCLSAIFGKVTERTFEGVYIGSQKAGTQLIILEDGETETTIYINVNSWIFNKWESSELLKSLVPGQRYLFRSTGFRWPWYGSYPNMISATPIP